MRDVSKKTVQVIIIWYVSMCFTPHVLFSSETVKKAKSRIVFEERTIEGKIRRPQVIVIQTDPRPEFMSLAELWRADSVISFTGGSVGLMTQLPYALPFHLTTALERDSTLYRKTRGLHTSK